MPKMPDKFTRCSINIVEVTTPKYLTIKPLKPALKNSLLHAGEQIIRENVQVPGTMSNEMTQPDLNSSLEDYAEYGLNI